MKKLNAAFNKITLLGISMLALGGCAKNAESVQTDDAGVVTVQETETGENADGKVIDNYNMQTVYTQKPQKVITLSLNSAEIIAALGEADAVAAVQTNNNLLTDLLPEYYEELKDVNVPESLNTWLPPTLEAVLGEEPDFVAMNAYYFYVPTFGTVEDYQSNNVKLYVMEGSYTDGCTIENTYNDIRNLGIIFDRTQEADAIIADMQVRLDAVRQAVDVVDTRSVMAFDSMSDNLYIVTGGNGLEDNLFEIAGVENVFGDLESDFLTVGIEDIIERNPDYIIIHNYTTDENDAQEKIDFLLSQEELSSVSAIQDKNFIIVNLFQINPGIQNADFVETVAEEVYPEVF